MDDNFSSRVKDVISYSKEEALRLGHKQIGTEHLLLGMLRDGGGKAISILNSIEVNLDELRKKIEILNPAIIDSSSIGLNEKKNLHLTRQAERALKTTFLEAKLFQSTNINTAHLLLCILRNDNDPITKVLLKMDITYDNVKDIAEFIMSAFVDKKFDKVILVYNRFKNAATQVIMSENFLPLEQKKSNTNLSTDYLYEPSQEEVVRELIPKSLKTQLFKAVLDSHASEHGARMTAMHKDNNNWSTL